ncbi:putative flap endonuclease 1-like protein [Huso huso]|uniref:Flap endonuclease 1-like protein n=1 Tax=Huso huso TaxID=61971 RepID=A0ABR1A0H5_HUSHU|nr:probable flap endonuclease 1 homolog isoform X3 [Acipenser ruthenus]
MGIVKLAELIRNVAPDAISHKTISDYSGKKIAVDASIVLFQFRTAAPEIRNRDGSHLSPLVGLFYRTLHFLENDIRPVYVFDGLPPEQKVALLERRAEAGGYTRTQRPVSNQVQDCQKILKLLGVPYLQAPSEAEALCAELVKCGEVDGVASEDMDVLPFGSSLLIRQIGTKEHRGVVEYSLPKVLKTLGLTHEQFVDLCILLGCDYCEKIGGLGPKRALALIQQHKTIEDVLLNINRTTHPVPENWKYLDARKLFLDPEVANQTSRSLSWEEPDEEGLVNFLSHEKYVKEERIRRRMEKFRRVREDRKQRGSGEGKQHQTRMDDFFRVTRSRQAPDAVDQTVSKKSKF